jgi:hypothetical protein
MCINGHCECCLARVHRDGCWCRSAAPMHAGSCGPRSGAAFFVVRLGVVTFPPSLLLRVGGGGLSVRRMSC